jgi:hypothetical protein
MAKAYDYVITLKQRSFKGFDWISQLLIFISLAVFGYTAYLYPDVRPVFLTVIGLTIASWIYTFRQSKKRDHIAYYRLTLCIASICWFYGGEHGNGWIGGLLVLVAFLERQVKFPEEVGFNEEGVTFNSFPKKQYAWDQISNAVLKDGLLTVDKKNNKLFQKEVEQHVNPAIENEFNLFCTNMLTKQNITIQA